MPGWDEDDHAAAFKTFLKSCDRVLAAARERTAADKVPPPAPPRRPWLQPAKRQAGRPAPITKAAAKAFFEQHFTPNAVVHTRAQGPADRLLRALMKGSRTPQGEFQTPIYKRPPDLVNLVDETQRGAVGMALTHARKTDKGVEPFATRAAIEQGALKGKGLELIYLRRSRRGVLPADPGLGPRQAHRRQRRCACTTTARTATPTARSAAT